MLRIENITLRRSSTFCLHLGNIRLTGGTILCVAGPNGSGKSTLIECLAGLLTSPTIRIFADGQLVSQNIRSTKTIIGYIPDDEDWFIKELCAQEYFNVLIQTYCKVDIPVEKMRYRVQYFASLMRFTAFTQPLVSLSHGNKKKVQLIAGLLHEPGIIILDELRNGLDPLAIIAAEKILRTEAARGACIVAATHDLWWAERIADETMLLIDGSVAIHKSTKELLTAYSSIEELFIALTEGGGKRVPV